MTECIAISPDKLAQRSAKLRIKGASPIVMTTLPEIKDWTSVISLDGGKTWSPHIKQVADAEIRRMEGRPSRFIEELRLRHELRNRDNPQLINKFQWHPWTIAWECKTSPSGFIFLDEVWEGGPMSWTYTCKVDSDWRYHTEEQARRAAAEALWDKKDPHCSNYLIVNIQELEKWRCK